VSGDKTTWRGSQGKRAKFKADSHELREKEKQIFRRQPETAPMRKQPKRECRFFAVFAQFVVSLSLACFLAVVFASFA
jgi:hypothetical protein